MSGKRQGQKIKRKHLDAQKKTQEDEKKQSSRQQLLMYNYGIIVLFYQKHVYRKPLWYGYYHLAV